ncbi:RNA polymerase subunit sigma-28, partial [Heliobacterium chlorum]
DYDASNLLIDFTDAVEEAGLTARQRLVLYLIYIRCFSQHEVAQMLNITQQGVSDHINAAVVRIATVNRLKEEGARVA